MWSLLPLDAIKRGLAANPWIKWALVVLVGLYAVEFIGSRAVELVVKLNTAKATIEKQNADASTAASEAALRRETAKGGTAHIDWKGLDDAEVKRWECFHPGPECDKGK